MRKKILITGMSGLLGSNLAFAYKDKHSVLGTYHDHEVGIGDVKAIKLDLFNLAKLKELIAAFRPDVLVHCAALSDVDKCEGDKALAYRSNVEVTKNVVKSLENTEAQLVHISTDAAYDAIDGNSDESRTDPVNYYGQTKLLGEKIASGYENSLILRTNFFGWNVQKKFSLSEWIIDSLKNGKTIKAFSDVVFSSIYTFFLAVILEKAFYKRLNGIYNLGSSDSMSKYNFALRLADVFQLDNNLIKKISVDEYCFAAKRCKNTSLNIRKIENDLKISIPTINDSISAFYKDYRGNIQAKLRECLV